MSRPYWSIISLLGILALLGLTYASLPMILAGLIKQTLSVRGLSDVQVKVGYPDWRGVHLDKLKFSANAGAWQIDGELTYADIEYHIKDLLTGSVKRIQVAAVVMHVHPVSGVTPSVRTPAALPLAALLSGHWLTQLPLEELLLKQLTLDWRTLSDTVYLVDLTGTIRDADAQLDGKITLPTPQRKQVVISLNARKTGQARLALSPSDNSLKPVLELAVDNVVTEQHQTTVNGVLKANLDTLMPILEPWLTRMAWAADLKGIVKSQWQAILPAALAENAGQLTVASLPGNTSEWRVTGEARVHDLSGRWHEQPLPRGEVSARFEAGPQQGLVQSTWRSVDEAVVLEVNGIHQFTTDSGHADLRLKPVVFADSGFVLSQLLEDWPYPFDITRGRLSGTGQLDWQLITSADASQQWGLKPKLVLRLDKLGGLYKKITFMGLSTELSLENGAGLRTAKETQLKLDFLDVGFPVENIVVNFGFAPNSKTQAYIVGVKKFTADLLGGKAQSEPFKLDFGQDKNQILVKLEHINLHDIMQLEQQASLQGTGVLDGQIPVEIRRGSIEVTHGSLSARTPGGVIRYLPTEKVSILAKTNPSVKMVVDALNNFQYHVLEVTSDYKPTGDLSLQVHLQGENPDWQAGQPVHLNLNLEENIPALLRSLQLSGEITDRVRKQYEKTH